MKRKNMPVNMRHKGLVLPFQREVCMVLTVGCDLWVLKMLNIRWQTQHSGPGGCRKTAGPPRGSGLIQQTFISVLISLCPDRRHLISELKSALAVSSDSHIHILSK